MNTFKIMAFQTFTGKKVYRVLTNGGLDTQGAAKAKFSSLERAQKHAEKFAAAEAHATDCRCSICFERLAYGK